MRYIIIRTNFGKKVGLGHIFRVKYLAEEFIKKKYKVIFFVDKNSEDNKILKKLKLNYLEIDVKNFNQKLDSNKILKIIKNINVKYIIIDDYRISSTWENTFYKKYKLIVIDDLANRKHKCHYLIDTGWYGNIETNKRYLKLVPKSTIKILGPRFFISDPNIKRKNIKQINIMFYFGAGTHIKVYFNLIKKITDDLKNNKSIKFYIVLGAYLKNNKKLNILFKKNKSIVIIENNLDIGKYISRINFYIGSTSSIINNLNYTNCVRILISLNKFQNINILNYENLGNYFFIKNIKKISLIKFTKLTNTIINNFLQIKLLHKKKNISVDKNGAKRIFNRIIKNTKDDFLIKQKKYFLNKLKPVDNTHINKFYISRIKKHNNMYSLNNKFEILDHYNWWFTNNRKIFYYNGANGETIYLWYELISFNQDKFWTCGLHTTNKKINFIDLAESYYLLINKLKKLKKYNILGVMYKKNIFIRRLNIENGFKEIINRNDKQKIILQKKLRIKKNDNLEYFRLNII